MQQLPHPRDGQHLWAVPGGALHRPHRHSGPDHGLLFFNNVILPFADDFPKDTELYKLLTTKPSEVEHAAETEA